MRKFRKGLTFKIISICVAVYFFANTIAYAVPTLRVNSMFDNINKDEDVKRSKGVVVETGGVAPRQLYADRLIELNPFLNGTSYKTGYVDEVFDDNVDLFSRTVSKDRTIKKTVPMRISGLDELLFSLVRRYGKQDIEAVLLGAGLYEMPDYVFSSPQMIEFLAILSHGSLAKANLTIIDRSQQVLDATMLPAKYVTHDIEYTDKMQVALSSLFSGQEKDGNALIFDVIHPENVDAKRIKANFEDLDYGKNEIDLMVTTTALTYVFKRFNDSSRNIEFFSKLVNALRPNGKLLVDVNSFYGLIPELKLLGSTIYIDSVGPTNREKLIRAVAKFEQLLLDRFGIDIHMRFFKEVVEVTKLDSKKRNIRKDDMQSRIIEPTLASNQGVEDDTYVNSETGQKVNMVVQEAAGLFDANTPAQCVDATRWIAAKLDNLDIKNQERTINIPFDASKEIEIGDPTTSHTILEAIFDDTIWVIDTQLMQFTLLERNKLKLPEKFVFQYVYQASDYYAKVPVFSDSVCAERIDSATISLALNGTAKEEFLESITVKMLMNGEPVSQNEMKQVMDKPLYADIGPCICLINGDRMFHVNNEVYLQYNEAIMNRIRNSFDFTKTTYIFDNTRTSAINKALSDIPNAILWERNNKAFRKVVLYPNLEFKVYDEDIFNNPLIGIKRGIRSAI